MARPKGPALEVRIMQKVRIDKTGCFLFEGFVPPAGYGMIWKDGKTVAAHREMYRIFCGPLSDEEVVCHKCDVRNCVNPEHFFKGDRADNNRDMREKMRHAFGEKAGQAKLTQEQADFIKSSTETQAALARRFGVNQSTICRLKSGKRWKHMVK